MEPGWSRTRIYQMEFHSGTTSSGFHTEYIDYIRLYDTGWSFILVRLHPGSILSIYIDYIRLYDTGWSFILVRLHPGSILSIYIDYIRLYDTGWSFILVRLHPGSILSIYIDYIRLYGNSIWYHINEYSQYRYSVWNRDEVVPEWNSIRYHINEYSQYTQYGTRMKSYQNETPSGII